MLSRVGGGNSKVGKMLDGEAEEEYDSNLSVQYSISSSNNHITFNPSTISHSHHQYQFLPHLQTNLFPQIQTQPPPPPPPPFIHSASAWTDEELLALFNIRSTIHNSFPDQLTWDHVSRKLAELGFKKSAEKCKEKFEDENRSYFKNIDSYRFVSELQGLYDQCHDDHGDVVTKDENSKDIVMTKQCGDDDDDEKVILEKSKEIRKRKRRDRFEMFKCFCESVVNNMMSQQEQIHNKLLEDILKRDEEKVAKEEAWKKQEMERMNKELDIMAQEQAIANDRQANIIQFFNKYLNGNNKSSKGCSSSSPSPPTQLHSQNPNYDLPSTRNNNNLESSTTPCSNSNIMIEENPSSSDNVVVVVPLQQVPSSSSNNNNNPILESNSTSTLVDSRMEDIKRRWPRDEVLALINLKCISSNNNNNVEEKEGNNNNNNDNKGPLWERISQGMLELGYKRNAKRCKEKWENINKYFRKTKDVVSKKKRSLDSRTCPYFHQLSCLYNKQQEKQGGGKLISLHPNINSAHQSSDSPVASGN